MRRFPPPEGRCRSGQTRARPAGRRAGRAAIARGSILAAALWAMVLTAGCTPPEQERDLFVALRYEGLPATLTLCSEPPRGLDLRLAGPAGLLDDVARHPPVLRLDLSHASAGIHTVALAADRLDLPRAVRLLRMTPESVTLRIETVARRDLPVGVAVQGQPAAGYRAAILRASPPTVTVEGAAAALGAVTHLDTHPVDIGGRSETFSQEISLALPDNLHLVGDLPPVVRVRVDIRPQIVLRRFEGIPVKGRHTSHAHTINPPAITLEVEGPAEALDKLRDTIGQAVGLDLDDMAPGVYVRRAVIDLPVGLTLKAVDPELFTVTITPR